MNKVGWAIIGVLAATQLAFAIELMELSSLFRRIASIDEKTAMVKNATANKELENERIRNTYYRVLVNGPFVVNEETVDKIIREGVKAEREQGGDGEY